MALHLKISTRQVLAAALVGLLMTGCSWTPDWANPVEWYSGTRDSIMGADEKTQDARSRAKAKSDQGVAARGNFPNLASVPDRPQDISSSAQRGKVEQGLVADRSQSRHAALGPGDNRMSRLEAATPPPAIPAPPAPSQASMEAAAPPARVPAPPAPVMTAAKPLAPAMPAPTASMPSQGAAMPAPSQVTPSRMPPESDGGVRQAFQQALAQSGATVMPAAAPTSGVRDKNASNVPMAAPRGTMLSPPVARRNLTLKPPPGNAPVSQGSSASLGQSAVSVQVGTVLFSNGSSKLSRNDIKILNNIAKIKKEKGGTLRVIGHASSRTRDVNPLRHRLVNFRLSLARANVVARRLVQLGIPAQDVQVMAKADNDPVYYEFMPAGEAGNRRAEIYLDY